MVAYVMDISSNGVSKTHSIGWLNLQMSVLHMHAISQNDTCQNKGTMQTLARITKCNKNFQGSTEAMGNVFGCQNELDFPSNCQGVLQRN